MNLRQVKRSDIREVITIADECGLSPWTYKNLSDEIVRTDAVMLIAETEPSATAGFIVGRANPKTGEGEIYNIGVTAKFRRRGVGRSLLSEFITRCRKAKVTTVWLEVRLSNIGARAFYTDNGFERVSTRRSFYSDPIEDAILMKAEL